MLDKCQQHLDSVRESYFQHLCFAVCFGLRLVGAGLAAILHGLFPAVFQTTGSATVYRLADELRARQAGTHRHDHS